MAVPSGVGAQFGFAPEVTYGTYVAPTKWTEVNSASLHKVKNTVQGGGIAAGRRVPLITRSIVTTKGAEGSVELQVPNKGSGFGVLLNMILGSGAVTPVQQAATTAYLQTHNFTDPLGKMMSMQVGLPQTDGTVKAFSYVGCKPTSATFSCGVDEILTLAMDIDARDADEGQTLASPSYPATVGNFHFGQMAVKIGATYGAEATVDGVSSMSATITNPQKTDRFYAGNAGLKSQPLVNEMSDQVVTGTISTDFLDKTVYNDRFANHTTFSLVWEFVGPIIASTYAETFRLKFPACKFTGDTPQLDGPDVIGGDFPFVALSDGTNAAVIAEYMSTDTAL